MSINWKDLGLRAFHTFWTSFTAAFGLAFAASGANVSQIIDLSSAKRFALALLIAAGSAALVALRLTVKAAVVAIASRTKWTPTEMQAAFDFLGSSLANVTVSTAPANTPPGGIQPGAAPETTTAPPAGTPPPLTA